MDVTSPVLTAYFMLRKTKHAQCLWENIKDVVEMLVCIVEARCVITFILYVG